MKKIIAGNWKMNTNLAEAISLAEAIDANVQKYDREVIIFPPFVYLSEIKKILKNVKLGSQNCYYEEEGAFTGEISAQMIADFANYVIVGHSERRHILGETDEGVAKKIKAVFSTGLIPILCIGETEQEKNNQQTFEVIKKQLISALSNLRYDFLKKIIIAYEPVWAIGTGQVCDLKTAEKVAQDIRNIIDELAGEPIASSLPILYGGSVKSDNSSDFINSDFINGVLVGGASLSAKDFIKIINS